MGRVLKYKDVVNKKSRFNKQNSANAKQRRKKSKTIITKKSNILKSRRYMNGTKNKKKVKHDESLVFKADTKKEAQIQIETSPDSSESEDERVVDPLSQLRGTFSGAVNNSASIESSSEDISDTDMDSDVDDEVNESSMISDTDRADFECEGSTFKHLKDNDRDTEKILETEAEELDKEIQLEEENLQNFKDPFVKHICYEIHPNLLESLESDSGYKEIHKTFWPRLGNLIFEIPKPNTNKCNLKIDLNKTVYACSGQVPKKISRTATSKELFIKSQIYKNIHCTNKNLPKEEILFSTLQQELFSILNNYQDLYFPERTFDNAEEIRFVYCLHALNHILKTRTRILHHNAKLSKRKDVPEEFRDQGLVRPKVLIVVPFKDSAFKVISTIMDTMFQEDKGNVIKKNRFLEDFTGGELYLPKKNPKPEDYEKTFCGNIGDDFKMGISVTKKSLKLYSDFYTSDIIVASPLGLRTIIGAEGEPNRDYDFLASVELLILDQAEIFLMQNWDHVMHIFNHLHLKPRDLHGTDVSRVRQWSLNLWAKYYRQTLIFSSKALPELNSVFNKKCSNYEGKAKVLNPVEVGFINQVFVQVPHVFHRYEANNPAESIESRFNFFTREILPSQKDVHMKQTLIFIPSYFDYVRIRNYFKKEDLNFGQICEYSKENKIARARDMFYHGDTHFLLYTERYHFYNRIRIKGIRHLVFYQLPAFSQFYYEMCNLMQEVNMNKKIGSMTNMTVSVIYSKYDIVQLEGVVGTNRAAKMLQSDRKVHLMVTGSA